LANRFDGVSLGFELASVFSLAKRFRGRETFFNAALGVCRLTHDGVAFGIRRVVPVPAMN